MVERRLLVINLLEVLLLEVGCTGAHKAEVNDDRAVCQVRDVDFGSLVDHGKGFVHVSPELNNQLVSLSGAGGEHLVEHHHHSLAFASTN